MNWSNAQRTYSIYQERCSLDCNRSPPRVSLVRASTSESSEAVHTDRHNTEYRNGILQYSTYVIIRTNTRHESVRVIHVEECKQASKYSTVGTRSALSWRLAGQLWPNYWQNRPVVTLPFFPPRPFGLGLCINSRRSKFIAHPLVMIELWVSCEITTGQEDCIDRQWVITTVT